MEIFHEQWKGLHLFRGDAFSNLLKNIQLASKSPRMGPFCQHHRAKLCLTSIQSDPPEA